MNLRRRCRTGNPEEPFSGYRAARDSSFPHHHRATPRAAHLSRARVRYSCRVNIGNSFRPEALADARGVFVSNTVHDQVRDRLPFIFEDLGEQQVKNIARPVRVYRVRDADAATKTPSAPTPPVLPLPDKP